MHLEGGARADLLAPGHPLLEEVLDRTLNDLAPALTRGAVFVDRSAGAGTRPRLVFSCEQEVRCADESLGVVRVRHDHVVVDSAGEVSLTALPPWLDFDAPRGAEAAAVAEVLAQPWLGGAAEEAALLAASEALHDEDLPVLEAEAEAEAARVSALVRDRLDAEIDFFDRQRLALLSGERGRGRPARDALTARTAKLRADELVRRRDARLALIERRRELVVEGPRVLAVALVVPEAMLTGGAPDAFATNTVDVERRAVEAVLAAERALGRAPVEMPRNNPGFDVMSTDGQGRIFRIEVKGRIEGGDVFVVTANEVAFAQSQGDRHRLAMVRVSEHGAASDEVRYVCGAFDHLAAQASTRSFVEAWEPYWGRGGEPC